MIKKIINNKWGYEKKKKFYSHFWSLVEKNFLLMMCRSTRKTKIMKDWGYIKKGKQSSKRYRMSIRFVFKQEQSETKSLPRTNAAFNINITRNETQSLTGLEIEGIDIAFIIQQVLSLCFNTSLLSYIISDRKLRSKKPNQFFVNLLLVHIILSLAAITSKFVIPFEVAVFNNGIFMEMFFSLVICSFDRYINITFPFKYAFLTTTKILGVIVISWFISTVFVVLAIVLRITNYQTTLVCTALIIFSSVILLISNIHIYLIARRHASLILKNNTAASDAINREKRSLRATRVCFSLVLSFILLWLPFSIHNAMVLSHLYKPSAEKFFTKAVFNVGCFNSLVDPILYICFRKDMKARLMKVFLRKSDFWFDKKKWWSSEKRWRLWITTNINIMNTIILFE